MKEKYDGFTSSENWFMNKQTVSKVLLLIFRKFYEQLWKAIIKTIIYLSICISIYLFNHSQLSKIPTALSIIIYRFPNTHSLNM